MLRRGVIGISVFLLAGCLSAQNAPPQVYVPHSGDVDHDGVLTTHDAQLIMEIVGGLHASRPDLPQILLACDINNDGQCDMNDANFILSRVVTDFNDYDGDGVPNALDCAPLDARIATPNNYYPDIDQDGFGSTVPYPACSPQPPVPLLAWGNDPDDTNTYVYLPPVPKGSRQLAIDFTDLGNDQKLHTDLVQNLGADAAAMRLQWAYLEGAPFVFNGPQAAWLPIANTTFAQQGLALTLNLDPIAGSSLAMPSDLRYGLQSGTLTFSSPSVVNRYLALLSFVHSQLGNVRVVSLQIGQDVDLYAANPSATTQFWADYYNFYTQMAGAAKAMWGSSLKVGMTATANGLVTEPTRSIMLAMNQTTDVVDVSYLPHNLDYTAIDPRVVSNDFAQLVGLYPNKPLYLQSVGFPSAPVAASSETKQSQFLYAFFDAWDQYAANIPFACVRRLFDLTPAAAIAQAQQISTALQPSTAGFVLSLGLMPYDGSQRKSGYDTLRNLAFQRGWQTYTARSSRSFLMGFTPALYDIDPAMYSTVSQNVWSEIAANSGITALHFDSGIPWVEAYADTFTSVTPPYSASLLATWNGFQANLPPGHRLLVSINPLGVPRQNLADYWGYGEGFRYSDTFTEIPNGIWADGGNRILPAPWNTYDFGSSQVQQAFLNYCIRVIDFFHPDYLVTAIEASAALNADPAVYPKLLQLQKYVYQGLKSLPAYRSVKILVSFSGTTFMTDEFGVPIKYEDQPEGKREVQLQGLYDILPYVDMVGISLYPHFSKYNATVVVPSAMTTMFELLQTISKPYAITESGFPASYYDLFGMPFLGSEGNQDSYFNLLFAESEKYRSKPAFIVNYAVRDLDTAWNELLQMAQTDPTFVLNTTFVQFCKYFRDIGVFDVNGVARSGTQTWQSEFALSYTLPAVD